MRIPSTCRWHWQHWLHGQHGQAQFFIMYLPISTIQAHAQFKDGCLEHFKAWHMPNPHEREYNFSLLVSDGRVYVMPLVRGVELHHHDQSEI